MTVYQRANAGTANLKNCADYTAIDSFTIRHAQAPAAPAEPGAQAPAAPAATAAAAADTKPKAESTFPWVAVCCAAAAVAVIAALVTKRKKAKKET